LIKKTITGFALLFLSAISLIVLDETIPLVIELFPIVILAGTATVSQILSFAVITCCIVFSIIILVTLCLFCIKLFSKK